MVLHIILVLIIHICLSFVYDNNDSKIDLSSSSPESATVSEHTLYTSSTSDTSNKILVNDGMDGVQMGGEQVLPDTTITNDVYHEDLHTGNTPTLQDGAEISSWPQKIKQEIFHHIGYPWKNLQMTSFLD